MALFVVRHQHEADRCPARDPDLGAMLLNCLSRPNVRQQGVEIRGEAVLQGEHTLYLIVESSEERYVRNFMEPFARAGSVDVHAASTCVRVVASGGCARAMPAADGDVVDPDEACQRAIDAGLVVHRAHPLNCETSIPALIVFRGADGGNVPGRSGPIHFERSLKLDDARDSEVLLAYTMNGEPLPVQHGHPLRLVVPGWYGVSSVKWLTGIEANDHPFSGYFQTERYWYEWEHAAREPVTLQRVRALITEPGPDQERDQGQLVVRGVAWSGAAAIARVEVSLGGGPWQEARLLGERHRHSWQWWELSTWVGRPGRTSLRARATDLAGRAQPEQPEWNRLGYGGNAIQEMPVRVQ